MDLFSLPIVYYNSKLYLSALTFSDFILNTCADDKIDLCPFRLIQCLSLFELGYYHKALRFIEYNGNLLNYHAIRTIYLKLGSILDSKNISLDLLKNKDRQDIFFGDDVLDKQSIEYYHEALVKKHTERKNMLLEAIKMDSRNFEAFITLKREDLVSVDELNDILNANPDWLKTLYLCITYYKEKPIFSPFFIEIYSYGCFKEHNCACLFNIGVEMLEDYPRSSASYIALGCFYFEKKNFSESKKCFYEAIKYDKQIGNLWLLLGQSYSGLKECENAISCYNQAKQLMIGSYKPDFYLACEYHKMYNIEQANLFYLKALKIKAEPIIIVRYATLLIYYEYYVNALNILAKIGDAAELQDIYNLLIAYAFLFTGDLEKAESFLEKCTKDWRYLATKGFIKHLKCDIDTAADVYTDALIKHGRSWIIEDLLKLTIEIRDKKAENIVYEYANDLFDAMDLKSLEFTPD